MAEVAFDHVDKIYDNGVQAVFDLSMQANDGEFLGYWRLRDWLRLLSFEVQGGRFGCYRPPLKTDAWLARYAWTERIGERWWPVLGSVYLLVAVKRVRGMRLVGLLPAQQRPAGKAAPVVAAHRHHHHNEAE
jgi:hypothetical protein